MREAAAWEQIVRLTDGVYAALPGAADDRPDGAAAAGRGARPGARYHLLRPLPRTTASPSRRLTMQRREFLIQTGLASLAPAAAQTGGPGRPGIKITDIKTYLVGV